MTTLMDYLISPLPIRLLELKVDKSKLRKSKLIIGAIGHLPGRISRRRGAEFPNWALAYITDGNGTYQVDGGPVQKVTKGSLFFIWQGASFNYGPLENESWEEYYIIFEGSRIEELVECGSINKGTVTQVGVERIWNQRIELLISLLESGIPANADRASMQLESLLYEFSLMSQQNNSDVKAEKPLKIVEDLSLRVYEPIDDSALAKDHNLSVSSLRRIVKLYTGYPFNEYMHRLKISEAKKLLVNTPATVKEIGYALGYQDIYYFSRLFRKYAGLSPKQFREAM